MSALRPDGSEPVPRPRSQPAMINGLPISSESCGELLEHMSRAVAAREVGKYISVTNTESMYHGLRIPNHGEYIRQANFSICDGVGVIVAGWAWGHNVKRLNGPILLLECAQHGIDRGWRHFFYGGKDGVADEMARRLKAIYPGVIVCGTYCPPFRPLSPEEDEEVVKRINAAKPDIVWVGLGLLKQERWIADHLGRVKAPWMVGVGAAFDYHSGAIPWAPAPLRALGLEWLFRLIIQPKLRAQRYWWSAVYVAQTFARGLFAGEFLRRSRELSRPMS